MAKRKFSLMGEVQNASQTNSNSESSAEKLREQSSVSKGQAINNPKDESFSPTEVRATFIVSPMLVRKLKLIGTLENRKHKDIVGTALAEYIEKWEKKHPSVNLEEIGNLVK